MAEFAVRAAGLAKQFHLRHQQSYYRFTEFIENIARNAVQFPSRLLNQGLAGSERNQTPTAETFWALDDVSFQVKRGEVVGVIGRNGAGKSTFLKAIMDLVPRASGRIEIFGQSYKRSRHRVGYVPQRESVDWDFPVSVLDVVTMGLYGKIGWCMPVRRIFGPTSGAPVNLRNWTSFAVASRLLSS